MDSKKFKKKLNKITTIYDSMQADQSISTLEQELLKKYVIQLYETLIDSSTESPVSSQKSPRKSDAEVPVAEVPISEVPVTEEATTSADRVPEIPTSVPETIAPVMAKVEVPMTASTPPAPMEATVPEPLPRVEKISIAESLKQSIPAAAAAVGASAVVANTLDMPADLQPIFEKVEATDLSDRLSITKVKDIGSSMGINEKIFTIKELFGGDQTIFNSVVSKLDACTSYEEAALYLSSTVARDYKWADGSKVKKAKTFVKLVQRKFV